MRIGLTVSVVGHTALLLASLLGFASTRKLQAGPTSSVPVEIVTVGGATESKLGLRKGEDRKDPALEKHARQADAPREGPEKAKPSKTEAQLAPAAPKPPEPKPVEPRHVEPKHVAEAPPETPRPKPQPAKAEPAPEPVKKAENAEPLPQKKPEPKVSPPKPKPQTAKMPDKPAPTRPVAQTEQKFDTDKISALL